MNPYQILGISPSASDDEVKKAYRTLSKKYHPDANIGNPHQAEYTEKFKEVQNAYKTIMDERKKGFRQQSYGGQTTGGYQYTVRYRISRPSLYLRRKQWTHRASLIMVSCMFPL